MSQYDPIVPTIRGRAMITQALAEEKALYFTRVEWGDGVKQQDAQQELFTGLIHKVIESGVTKKRREEDTLYLTTVYDNSKIKTGFYVRELGVYAKVGQNGQEYLFAYTYASNASYTPASSQYNEKRVTIALGVDAQVNVIVKFNSQQYATREELDAHDANTSSHEVIFNNFVKNVTRVNDATFQITKGDNTSTTITIDNVAHAGSATSATNATYTTTASSGDNSTRIASTAYVFREIASAVAKLINSAPGTLDTLDKLAAALGDDPNFATTITNLLALKAPLSSPTFTGTPRVPTASSSSNDTQAASTSFVKSAMLAFLTDRNFVKAVMDAIGSETLSRFGVKYNFDNPNAWSISLGRLFGGLILQGIKVSGTTGGSLNSGYSEGEKLITYPIPFKELLGFTSGLVDTSATFAEHASVNPNNSNARVFLHALTATNVEITTWIWLVGI